MHIVIDAREWSTTTGRYISSLVRQLERIDSAHDYSVLLYPADLKKWQPANPRFSKVACPHKEFTFDEQLGLKRQLDGLKADLVHFAMVQQPVLYKGKTVTTMNDLTGIRFRNPSKNALVFTLKQQVYKWLNKRVARRADALITYTEYVKNDVASYARVGLDKFTVTPLAAGRLRATPEPVAGLAGKPFVMYVGRPMPHKNLPRLIEAFKRLQAGHPELRLVLAGNKDALYRRIEAVVKRQRTANIVFTGRVSDGQLRWLYEHCAAYVFPSLSEGFGLPGLEAMAHGAPVVSSNTTCLPEVYGDGALYFDPLNIEDMAARISEVLDSPERRQQLVNQGSQQAAKYSWERTARQTLAVYERLLTGA